MDLGSFSVRWCVKPSFFMVCLLGIVRYSYGDQNNCPCPQIPPVNLAEPPPRGCYNITNTFRYKCIDGYVRKAGTSNLIRCKNIGSVAWTLPTLSCIPNPQRITTPPNIPVTAPSSTEQTTQSSTISASVAAETDDSTTISASVAAETDDSTTTSASVAAETDDSTTISASVAAETDDIEPTSPGLQVPSDYTQDEKQIEICCSSVEPVRTSTQPSNSAKTTEPVRTSTQPSNSAKTTASPMVHMTRSTTISASLAAETDRIEPTSPGFQVLSDHTQKTRGADQTSKPSILSNKDNSTSAHSHSTSAVMTNVMSAVVAGVIIILLIGIGSFFYRRRTRKFPLHTSDELVPMNATESGLRCPPEQL